MTEPYEEIVRGEVWLRSPPSKRHETVCQRLHELIRAALAGEPDLRVLPPRSVLEVRAGTLLRPDLTVVDQTGKAVLVAEVIYPGDHRPDTVLKKSIYEESEIPRLWMIDLRYHCVEIYESTPYGLALRQNLAGMDRVEDTRWPSLAFRVAELFEGLEG